MSPDTLPRKIFELNRTIVCRTAEGVGSTVRIFADGASRVADASLVAGRTVFGQTRSAVDRTTTTTRDNAAQVAGQTRSAVDRTAKATRDNAAEVAGQTRSAVGRTAKTTRDNAAEVAGQTRSAVGRTAKATRDNAAEVAGQVEAQGADVADAIDHEANRAVDRATDAVDGTPGSGVPYEDWTRAELYQRAQELEIDGRATMNKKQLIAALRS